MQVSAVYQLAIGQLARRRGWPVRMLSRLFRLDRGTVSRILSQRRIPFVSRLQITRRCPDCGALMTPPCLACQLRQGQIGQNAYG